MTDEEYKRLMERYEDEEFSDLLGAPMETRKQNEATAPEHVTVH